MTNLNKLFKQQLIENPPLTQSMIDDLLSDPDRKDRDMLVGDVWVLFFIEQKIVDDPTHNLRLDLSKTLLRGDDTIDIIMADFEFIRMTSKFPVFKRK